MQFAVIFPFGITVYLLCIVLQIILGARKGYWGAITIVGLYLIGGLAFCLGSHTLEDYPLTILLAFIQCLAFVGSLIASYYGKNNSKRT